LENMYKLLNMLTIVKFLIAVLIYHVVEKKRQSICIDNLHNRHVLITGCDSGFGKIAAKKLDKMGLTVYAGCFLKRSMEKLEKECSSNLKAFHLDVTDVESIHKAVEFVTKNTAEKGLWAVVNNAGIPGCAAPFEWGIDEDYQNVFDVNFFGVVKVTRAFLPLIRKNKEGRVIVMSSMFGKLALIAEPYTCAKHAVDALASALSQELAPFNISTHILNPTFYLTPLIATERLERTIKERFDNLPNEVRNAYGEQYLAAKINSSKYIWEHGHADIVPVADAYVHAVTAKYPLHRYNHISWDSYITVALGYLPRYIQNLLSNVVLTLIGSSLVPRWMQ